jgi:hypothetical protein
MKVNYVKKKKKRRRWCGCAVLFLLDRFPGGADAALEESREIWRTRRRRIDAEMSVVESVSTEGNTERRRCARCGKNSSDYGLCR